MPCNVYPHGKIHEIKKWYIHNHNVAHIYILYIHVQLDSVNMEGIAIQYRKGPNLLCSGPNGRIPVMTSSTDFALTGQRWWVLIIKGREIYQSKVGKRSEMWPGMSTTWSVGRACTPYRLVGWDRMVWLAGYLLYSVGSPGTSFMVLVGRTGFWVPSTLWKEYPWVSLIFPWESSKIPWEILCL